MNFNALDVAFIAIIMLFIIRCYFKGFLYEFFSIAAVVLGLIASIYFYKTGGEFIRERFMPDKKSIPEVIAFAALFLIIYILVKIIERMLDDIIEGAELGAADQITGLFFGLLEGVAVVSLTLFVLRIQPLFNPDPLLSGSFFANLLLPLIAGKEALINV